MEFFTKDNFKAMLCKSFLEDILGDLFEPANESSAKPFFFKSELLRAKYGRSVLPKAGDVLAVKFGFVIFGNAEKLLEFVLYSLFLVQVLMP